jgi:hypothetical protein
VDATETIEDAEYTETGLVVHEAQPPATLFHTDDPVEVIAKATATATALANVVKQQKLATSIQGRDHVRVEGWTLLGSMLGVFPVVAWTHKLENGWEARVEARTKDGSVVGAAEAECLRTENTWKNRDDYALRSMAQTRATSKALRGPLGFVMTLAGFDATPAEEMPREAAQRGRRSAAVPPDDRAAAQEERAAETAEKPAQARKASEKQIQKIAILRKKVIDPHFDEDQWRKWLAENFNVQSITELDSKGASALIERLVEAEKKL